MTEDIRTWSHDRLMREAINATRSTVPIVLHRWCAEKLEDAGSPRAGYYRGAVRALGGDR